MILTFDLLTSKSIGHILDSWGVCMWSFMMIGVKGKQLCAGNHFQSFMHCDLDLWPFDLKIYRAHSWLMESLHVKFHDDRCKGKAVMRRKPFLSNLCIVTLTFNFLTLKSVGHILDSWGDCMWSFMMIGVKGKQLCARNPHADDRRTDGRTDEHGDSSIPP